MHFVALSLVLILTLFAIPTGRQLGSSRIPDIDASRGFLEICAAVDKNLVDKSELEKFESGYCIGWLAGFTTGIDVAEARHGADKMNAIYCLPMGNSYGQMIHIIRKFIADHPEKEHLSTGIVAATALAQAFPCKEPK